MRHGDVQRMSAGSGVVHSEFNASRGDPVHFLQIWILPEKRGIAPGYEQKKFDLASGKWTLLGSSDGRDGSVTIRQDAALFGARLDGAETISFELKPSRRAWVHVAQGSVELNGRKLAAGDGAEIAAEPALSLANGAGAELLLFDLP
jgi:redox-sensitive bicupin YhaK (pirin superfamily)